MRRLSLILIVLMWGANASPQFSKQAVPSSVTGLDISAPLGQVFYGQIAKFNICSGDAITAIYAALDWGDGTGITTSEISEPLYLAQLFGTHTYATSGTFTITIALTAACWYTNGSYSQNWIDSPRPGNATATVPPEVKISSITVSPATVLRGATATATVTLANPAPSWGTLIRLGSSDTTAATLPPGVMVQGGSKSAVFTTSTLAFAGGHAT